MPAQPTPSSGAHAALGLIGEDAAHDVYPTPFVFRYQADLAVDAIVPARGPVQGGTVVQVMLGPARRLASDACRASAVRCRFEGAGKEERARDGDDSERQGAGSATPLADGRWTSSAPSRAWAVVAATCAADRRSAACVAPSWTTSGYASLALSQNHGADWSEEGAASFLYTPHGGRPTLIPPEAPAAGGARVRLLLAAVGVWAPSVGLACSFALARAASHLPAAAVLTPASFESASSLACFAPPTAHPGPATVRVFAASAQIAQAAWFYYLPAVVVERAEPSTGAAGDTVRPDGAFVPSCRLPYLQAWPCSTPQASLALTPSLTLTPTLIIILEYVKRQHAHTRPLYPGPLTLTPTPTLAATLALPQVRLHGAFPHASAPWTCRFSSPSSSSSSASASSSPLPEQRSIVAVVVALRESMHVLSCVVPPLNTTTPTADLTVGAEASVSYSSLPASQVPFLYVRHAPQVYRVEPTWVLAQGQSVLTVHGAHFPGSQHAWCHFNASITTPATCVAAARPLEMTSRPAEPEGGLQPAGAGSRVQGAEGGLQPADDDDAGSGVQGAGSSCDVLRCTTPPMAAGVVSLTVSRSAARPAQPTAHASGALLLVKAVAIGAVQPSHGPAAGGGTLRVLGFGFGDLGEGRGLGEAGLHT